MQLGMLLEGHSSAPDSGKRLNGTADDIDEQYVRRNEIQTCQRDKITVSNMGNVDVTGISHLGIDNDAEDDMKSGEMHRVPRNMEILSVTSSLYDENESPWEFPTSFTTDSPRGIAADSKTEVSEVFKKEAVCPVDIEGPEGGVKSLETSRVNPCKIHGAKFGASDREATADHPTAARNLALDDGDAGKRKEAVLINELNPNGTEDNTKNFAFHNQALVIDKVEETIF